MLFHPDPVFAEPPTREDTRKAGMKEVTSIRQMPTEVIEMILKLLPPRDLKTAVLVCKRWRGVGEAPQLWTWAKLSVTNDNLACVEEVLAYRRMKGIRRLEVEEGTQVDEELLQAVVRHKGVKEITLDSVDLSTFNQQILQDIVIRFEDIGLENTSLTSQQVESVITTTSQSLTLKKLYLSDNDLSTVEPESLGRAATRLEELSLI